MSGDNRNLIQAFVFEGNNFAMAPLGSVRIDTGDTRYVGALLTSLALKTGANSVLPVSGFSSSDDGLAPNSNNLLLGTLAENMIYDPATDTWNRASGARTDTGALATQAVARAMQTASLGFGFNGATFDRIRTASATNQALLGGKGILQTAPPGNWSVVSTPAAGVVATATRAAAGVGTRHIITGLVVSTDNFPAVPGDTLTITSGGVVLSILAISVATQSVYSLTGLNIVCPDNTAATIAFSAAIAAPARQSVNMYGYTAV